MEFSSLIFLFLFLPVFLLLFFVLEKKAHKSFLLMTSLVFYLWGEGEFVLLLLVSVMVNYLLGLLVERIEGKTPKKTVFIAAVMFNVGLLVYFKYTHFILDNLDMSGAVGSIHLPVGISFYTFQALSFLVDIYRKTVSMDRNPLNFGLYMALFPKLITGPITPYHDLRKQIRAERQITLDDFAYGVKRFTLGLGKKVLVADTLAAPANAIFAIPAPDLTAGLAWTGIVCYTLQIYFDFSGYTDMAIGIGRMCGFKLPENFNYPYIARSIKEFWRRWHISLAKWLRDYLFLPIAYSVSRKIKSPRLWGVKAENWAYFIGAFFTFLLCGIWHGANWTFFVWGGYYGLLLAMEHAGPGKWVRRHWWKPLQLVYCQLLVMMGWVFFRSHSLGYAFSYLKTMFGFGTGDGIRYYPALYLDAEVIVFMIIGIIGAFPLFPALNRWLQDQKQKWEKRETGTARHLLNSGYILIYNLYLLVILLASTMTMTGGTYNPFIYFRF
jgi:alginate O-acetyltransferase complex protein AlgI